MKHMQVKHLSLLKKVVTLPRIITYQPFALLYCVVQENQFLFDVFDFMPKKKHQSGVDSAGQKVSNISLLYFGFC